MKIILLALLFFLYNLLKIVLTLLTHFSNTAWKVSVLGVILVRVFPHSNWVSLRIQFKSFRIKSECGKIHTRINFYAVKVPKVILAFLSFAKRFTFFWKTSQFLSNTFYKNFHYFLWTSESFYKTSQFLK